MSLTEQQLESAIQILDEAKLLPDGATPANLDRACAKWLTDFRLKEGEPTPEETETANILSTLRDSLRKVVTKPVYRPFRRHHR